MDNFEIFSKTLFHEAGSTQEIFDVLMVAWTIRNRVEGKQWYGKNYKEVCLKKWQFSCWNNMTLDQIEKMDWSQENFRWSICRFVAAYVMDAPKDHNPISKVCYYFNPSLCNPSWAKKFIRIHPNMKLDHVFYKDPNDK